MVGTRAAAPSQHYDLALIIALRNRAEITEVVAGLAHTQDD
jgi:hypothetical protein